MYHAALSESGILTISTIKEIQRTLLPPSDTPTCALLWSIEFIHICSDRISSPLPRSLPPLLSLFFSLSLLLSLSLSLFHSCTSIHFWCMYYHYVLMMIWARPTFHFFHDLTRIHKQQQEPRWWRLFGVKSLFIKKSSLKSRQRYFLQRSWSEKVLNYEWDEILKTKLYSMFLQYVEKDMS